jgi:extracellular factor (EF) 3-hydroxypalmitic acid methyl ester biosynthesis protein
MENMAAKKTVVAGRTNEGIEFQGSIVRLTRDLVVFEVYNPACILQSSEVFGDFKILLNDRPAYSGRAVVRSLVNAGSMLVCEAGLEKGWVDVAPASSGNGAHTMRQQCDGFIREWQKYYRVRPEFKAVIADLQTFLADMRLWLEQVEMEIRAAPVPDRSHLEREAIEEISDPVISSIDVFIDKFEDIVTGFPPDLHPIHRTFLRRQLHPLVLCSPFAARAFHKPLGYAGDYKMVDMMMRPPHEGETLFAKIINTWLLAQAPAQAHRNRVAYLTRKLVEEAARARSRNQPLRVFNVGCGPAAEVQKFLREHGVSEAARFNMLDFNEETLAFVRSRLEEIKRQHGRTTPIQFVKCSVLKILKEAARSKQRSPGSQYDFVYCAGLFDYLTDEVCKQLMNIFYEMLAPGGLLLATNVNDALNEMRPFRYSMEYILDWHLIYRGGKRVASFAPEAAPPESSTVLAEESGVNVFIEVRRPAHA